jgi:hypothetical protein
MAVGFNPSAAGERNAMLVIHQNIPRPDRGTSLQLVGTGKGGPAGTHTLTVTVDTSTAAVSVASDPPGIDCPDMCTKTFDDGTDITLTATYDPGSGQISWEECDTPDGDHCHIHLNADHAVTARLSP